MLDLVHLLKQPAPPNGITPAGFPVGFEIVELVVKSVKPGPAGETEKELFVQTFTAVVQSFAVTTCAIVLVKKPNTIRTSKIFFMGLIISV